MLAFRRIACRAKSSQTCRPPSITQRWTQPTLTSQLSNTKTIFKRSTDIESFRSTTHRRQFSDVTSSQDAPTAHSSTATTINSSLSSRQWAAWQNERVVLTRFLEEVEEIGLSPADTDILRQTITNLDELFLLVVVGEFNSGKSTFINALLGGKFLKEGVVPTTSKVGLLKYGEEFGVFPHRNMSAVKSSATSSAADRGLEILRVPVEWLKEICLVDTPGTNAIVKEHQEITEHFVPRSDLVLFITSSDRAFSESEREFLEKISKWRKKILVVVSKRDIVETETELRQIEDYVSTSFSSCLGDTPSAMFSLSAKEALRAKVESGGALEENERWRKSGFGELEKYVLETLDRQERARIKLENPLGVAGHLMSIAVENLDSRSRLLKHDVETLRNVRDNMEEFTKEIKADFEGRKDTIDQLLAKIEEKAHQFLDERVHITKFYTLFRSEQLKKDFQAEVMGTIDREIEDKISQLIDWLVAKNQRLWKETMTSIQSMAKTSSQSKREAIDSINLLGFDLDRKRLLDSIGDRAAGTYEVEKESSKLADEVQKAIIGTAAVEVGAVAIGALLASSIIDVFGVGLLAAGGLVVLPFIKSNLKSQTSHKLKKMRADLKSTLDLHLSNQMQIAMDELHQAVQPYTKFVSMEQKKIVTAQKNLEKISQDVDAVRVEVASAFGKK
ncbi:hypothetical protein PROFUN_00638 [Planoprotostelium fungivorum]|uniref:Dynamin N-terminal domain-containing protein n=1 Tax=Planoprotostelium fungivorum TaxID=1890364 RepID=A0A2P6NTX4_9EUKA|nr:hypothetical protein PROFUN_00638 [Planoprotostelium fungivorum]